MGYFAELDADNIVVRVIVADSAQWCVDNLGGTWVETADPYSAEPQTVTYCGPGHGYDPAWPERFAPPWRQPSGPDDAYPPGALAFRNGKIWQNATEANVDAPGVGWTDTPGPP